MAETPKTVRVRVEVPIYVQGRPGDFVEIAVIEQFVDVTVEVTR